MVLLKLSEQLNVLIDRLDKAGSPDTYELAKILHGLIGRVLESQTVLSNEIHQIRLRLDRLEPED